MNRTFYLILFILCLAQPLFSETVPSTPADNPPSLAEMKFKWKKCSTAEGLNLYWSKVEGSQVIAFRGEGIVDAPVEKVASIIIDTTRGTEWIDSLVSSKVVREISPIEFIEYDHAGIPFPFDSLMHDRDFVSHVTLKADPVKRSVVVTYHPAEDDLAPPSKKYVRGTMTCEFNMVPMSLSDETYVEAEIHCDPKGTVPPWLVNFFQQGWPQTTFERLRKQAQKSDIQILPVVKSLLEKPPMKTAENNNHLNHRVNRVTQSESKLY